jgi:S1-C subfamily serine protease
MSDQPTEPYQPYGTQQPNPLFLPFEPSAVSPENEAALPPQRRGRRTSRVAWAAALVTVGAVAGAAVGVHFASNGSPAVAGQTLTPGPVSLGTNGGDDSGSGSDGSTGGTPGGSSGGTSGGTSGSTGSGTTSATATQEIGVVDIDTVLGYQGAKAAGTGLVLTSSGDVLTNNHVINGATSISVTVVTTGRTYAAKVVGYDVSDDLAVIHLTGASGLTTATFSSSSAVAVGTSVVGVGNAGGLGGTPTAAAGTVVATDQTITATDENGSSAEQLTGLIETDAAIAAGDSGGPLFDSTGAVVGIDTAASTSGAGGYGGYGRGFGGFGDGGGSSDGGNGSNGSSTSSVRGYAIPIQRALAVAQQIEQGQASSTIHLGTTAMLGVEVSGAAGVSGAEVVGVVDGSPAARAGLVQGDVITGLDGHAVTSTSALSTVVRGLTAGQRVSLQWTDTSGGSHRATVTMVAGAAA